MAVILVGLCLLAVLAFLVKLGPRATSDAEYRGKPVGLWFKEYAFASNPPAGPIVSANVMRDGSGRVVLVQRTAAGTVTTTSPTNAAAQIAWLRAQMSGQRLPAPDPAWDALQALGSNAVPFLVSQLRGIPFEQSYTRVFTNLPVLMQKKLPNPQQKRYVRIRALEALSKLGDSAQSATPAVLALLKDSDRSLRFAVLGALRGLHAERRAISQELLRLGAKGRYAEVVEIAAQTGWEGDDMAHLLGKLLKSPDPAVRREAMTLLERSGTAAVPETDGIISALGDSDQEVRYLAVRSLEVIGTNAPQITNALLASLNDSNVMIRTVARRTLLRIAPESVPEGGAATP